MSILMQMLGEPRNPVPRARLLEGLTMERARCDRELARSDVSGEYLAAMRRQRQAVDRLMHAIEPAQGALL